MRKLLLGFSAAILLGSCAKPIANYTFGDHDEVVPAMVNFENKSENAEEYFWDFGDGNQSTEVSPNHRYTKSGRYIVSLKAVKGNKTDMHSSEFIFDAPKDCLVQLNTNLGTMTIKLSDDTPLHRDNFLKLAKEGYYEDLLFHRVISNFMIQGGDPNSKNAEEGRPLGSGGPGYTVDAEFNQSNFHLRGALAAARQGDQVNPDKKSSGSQFYIVHGNAVSPELLNRIESQKGFIYPEEVRSKYLSEGGTPFLDQDYTVYGQLVSGFEVLDLIAGKQTDGRDRPVEDVKILSVEIIE